MNLAIAIPVFQPCEAFAGVVQQLAREPVRAIVVVDDGSGPLFSSRFDQVRALPRVHIVPHPVNRGKGAALKTAMRYALTAVPGCVGVVTADGDGQHHPADIMRVASRLLEHPGRLCLGVRRFDSNVPWRSRIGNRITRSLTRFVLSETLEDTQTGLRGIPASLLPGLLRIDANGYEFELEMLICAIEQGAGILEQPVTTIYNDANRGSHFRPVLDSMRVLSVLARCLAGRRHGSLSRGPRRDVLRASESVSE